MPFGPTITAHYAPTRAYSEGSTMVLRPPHNSDLIGLFGSLDPDALRYLPDDSYDYLHENRPGMYFRRIVTEPHLMRWGVHVAPAGEQPQLVGLAGVHNKGLSSEMLLLAHDSRGKGDGKRLTRLLHAAYFANTAMPYVDALVDENNQASLAMMAALGMQEVDCDFKRLRCFRDFRPELPETAAFADMVRALGETGLATATIDGVFRSQ